ncbi:MAG: NUDIX domain-containing protein [Candidatus Aenigmarchaeota archaeon]|nr:NUDIX domain-containing protein [Candidatus Aenigmarchaeota archaeon]
MRVIRKCALLLVRDKKLLLSREFGDSRFLTVGGSFEDGETDLQCLQRELEEEVGTKAVESTLEFLCEFVGTDGPEKVVHIHAYSGDLENEPKAAGEIEELRWFNRSDLESLPAETISEITKHKILPFLAERGMI